MTTTHLLLLLGIILAVTGIIPVVHYLFRITGKLPDSLRNDTLSPRAEVTVASLLVILGLPLLVIALNGG